MNKKSNHASNTFLKHIEQDEWNDIQAYHIEQQNMWRNIAFISIFALMLVSVCAMYFVNQDKHKTLVFEKDGIGNITFLGIANKTFDIDNKIIAHQLANFIISLREIPKDIFLRRRNIDVIHKMIDAKLQTEIDKNIIDGYTRANGNNVFVEISSIIPLNKGKSWIIHWSEIIEGVSTTHWGATLTFDRLDTVSPDIQMVNPTGIIITDVNVSEDVIEK